MIARALAWLLGIGLAASLAAAGVQTVRLARAQAKLAKVQRDEAQALAHAQAQARAAEQRMGEAVASAAAEYQRGRDDAALAGRRVTVELRTGALQLRDEWTCAGYVPQVAPSTAGPDGAAERRADGAGRAIAAADQCDAQVRGLQAIVRADRQR